MDNTLSVLPAANYTDLISKSAEVDFSDFLKQVTKPNSKGFISESNGIKIFSFETYLRESGRREDTIHPACDHIRSIDHKERGALVKMTDFRTWAKALLITMIPGTILYLLVTAFLWTFDIAFLKPAPFVLFALSCPFLYALLYLRQYLQLKKEEKSGMTRSQYFIKYFDNDELPVRSKSRLFVEKNS